MTPEQYMLHCLNLAQKAAEQDEVPIGAIVVDRQSGEIISEAYNLSEHVLDATAHAEIIAIRKACETLGTNRLRGMDLYVSLEPCTMCAAAISMARIEHLYFGAFDIKGGAVTNGVKFYEAQTCHHRPEVIGGILEAQCSMILKNFFKAKRNKS